MESAATQFSKLCEILLTANSIGQAGFHLLAINTL